MVGKELRIPHIAQILAFGHRALTESFLFDCL
jgi:hypothetical protein